MDLTLDGAGPTAHRTLSLAYDRGMLTVRLTRPERQNSITPVLLAELDAALDLTGGTSLVAISLRQVAKEVGIVPTAFYRHFDSIEDLGTYYDNAKLTIAVPEYSELNSIEDLAGKGSELDGKIYGIEPGNDGNRLLLDMVADDKFGLGTFEIVESSEQGMLAQVARADADHPMSVHPSSLPGARPGISRFVLASTIGE